MQEFNNVCLANQEDANAIKIQLFPVTLKKKSLEWYSQFGPNHFPDWLPFENGETRRIGSRLGENLRHGNAMGIFEATWRPQKTPRVLEKDLEDPNLRKDGELSFRNRLKTLDLGLKDLKEKLLKPINVNGN